MPASVSIEQARCITQTESPDLWSNMRPRLPQCLKIAVEENLIAQAASYIAEFLPSRD